MNVSNRPTSLISGLKEVSNVYERSYERSGTMNGCNAERSKTSRTNIGNVHGTGRVHLRSRFKNKQFVSLTNYFLN